MSRTGSLPDNYSSPIIADVTGSGSPQIIASEGPFLVAFDKFGNMTPIATTGNAPGGGTNEGIDAAAVVGNFNGGPGLTLAYVSYNPFLQNRPDQVQIYQLPQTNVAPPWPSLRRTASGDAVERSPAFDRNYVASAFFAALGRLPDQATLDAFQAALDADNATLLSTALTINTGPLAGRRRSSGSIRRSSDTRPTPTPSRSSPASWPRTPIANSRSSRPPAWSSPRGPTTTRPRRSACSTRRSSAGRTTTAETNAAVSANLPPGTLATMLIDGEGIGTRLGGLYSASFGAGAENFIPPDALAAYAFDIRHGAREEVANAELIASNGNYAATNLLAGYVRDLYRDVLGRDASSADVALWLGGIDNGSVLPLNLPGIFLNSLEGRTKYVQDEFVALLGHPADPGFAAFLAGVYPNRESVVLSIVGSPEYFARNGGTNAGFVQAVFRDLAGIAIDQANLNAFVTELNAGLPPVGVAQQLIYGGPLYFLNTVVNEATLYLPDEAQGVLRSGNLPPTAPGQPINPNPVLLAYLRGLQVAGFTDEQVIGVLLTSPQYLSRISYDKGLLRSPGVRS